MEKYAFPYTLNRRLSADWLAEHGGYVATIYLIPRLENRRKWRRKRPLSTYGAAARALCAAATFDASALAADAATVLVTTGPNEGETTVISLAHACASSGKGRLTAVLSERVIARLGCAMLINNSIAMEWSDGEVTTKEVPAFKSTKLPAIGAPRSAHSTLIARVAVSGKFVSISPTSCGTQGIGKLALVGTESGVEGMGCATLEEDAVKTTWADGKVSSIPKSEFRAVVSAAKADEQATESEE